MKTADRRGWRRFYHHRPGPGIRRLPAEDGRFESVHEAFSALSINLATVRGLGEAQGLDTAQWLLVYRCPGSRRNGLSSMR